MAKKEFPKYADCISMALTPMTLTARMIRTQHPKAKIVFVGPCAAKKLEAMRRSVRSEVDFVLTFEEMAGMMEARGIDYLSLADDNKSDFDVASADGRGFAVAGGVANAVVNAIHRRYPDREVNVVNAEGLEDCRKMMRDATKGKYPGYLLEGMACPGGCVAGAGTLVAIKKSAAAVRALRQALPAQQRHPRGLVSHISHAVPAGLWQRATWAARSRRPSGISILRSSQEVAREKCGHSGGSLRAAGPGGAAGRCPPRPDGKTGRLLPTRGQMLSAMR